VLFILKNHGDYHFRGNPTKDKHVLLFALYQ